MHSPSLPTKNLSAEPFEAIPTIPRILHAREEVDADEITSSNAQHTEALKGPFLVCRRRLGKTGPFRGKEGFKSSQRLSPDFGIPFPHSPSEKHTNVLHHGLPSSLFSLWLHGRDHSIPSPTTKSPTAQTHTRSSPRIPASDVCAGYHRAAWNQWRYDPTQQFKRSLRDMSGNR